MKMKLFTRPLSLLAIASMALFFANCGSEGDSKKPEEIELGKLSKQWSIVSADLGGTTRTADFTNFKLTLSGSFNSSSPAGPYDYDVSGNQPVLSPWPQAPDGSGGTWEFSGTPNTDSGLILRSDDVGMTYTISNGQLTLQFTLDPDAGYP